MGNRKSIKPLVCFHADCTDGFAAAFSCWLKLGDEAIYLPFRYGEETIPDAAGREVYILDFSFPRDVMDLIFEEAKRVVWLDHHKTAFEMWCGKAPNVFFTIHKESDERKHIVLDDCKSGALLAWEYFHPGTSVPMLIKHIDDRDRWQFKIDGSKELHAALGSMKPWSFGQWRNLFMVEDHHGDGPFFSDERTVVLRISGAAILRAQDAHVQSMIKQARKCMISYGGTNYCEYRSDELPKPKRLCEHLGFTHCTLLGKELAEDDEGWRMCCEGCPKTHNIEGNPTRFNGLAVNATIHMSEVGHELATTSGTFGLVYYIGADNRVKCSLRSNGEYDVSAIAKAFGGGGHKNAAGFETDIETLMGWIK